MGHKLPNLHIQPFFCCQIDHWRTFIKHHVPRRVNCLDRREFPYLLAAAPSSRHTSTAIREQPWVALPGLVDGPESDAMGVARASAVHNAGYRSSGNRDTPRWERLGASVRMLAFGDYEAGPSKDPPDFPQDDHSSF